MNASQHNVRQTNRREVNPFIIRRIVCLRAYKSFNSSQISFLAGSSGSSRQTIFRQRSTEAISVNKANYKWLFSRTIWAHGMDGMASNLRAIDPASNKARCDSQRRPGEILISNWATTDQPICLGNSYDRWRRKTFERSLNSPDEKAY